MVKRVTDIGTLAMHAEGGQLEPPTAVGIKLFLRVSSHPFNPSTRTVIDRPGRATANSPRMPT